MRRILLIILSVSAVLFAGGYIETKPDGRTVIHLVLYALPNQLDMSPFARSERDANTFFITNYYPRELAARYRDKYRADSAKYGKYNWDKVEVQLESFTGLVIEGVEPDLMAIAGGMAPDILYVNFRKSDNYIQNGFLYPLDKPEDGYITSLTEEEKNFRVHDKIWPVIQRKGPGGKHVWAMPYGGALGKVLIYRKELFDEKKIAYPDASWTWDDLLAAAKKLTDPKRGIYGIQFGRGKHESWHWITFLWSAGGEVMTYNEEKDEWRCSFEGKEAAAALDFYTTLNAEKWTDSDGKTRRGYSYNDTDASTKWRDGYIAMSFQYVDEKLFSTIDPETYGMAPVPLGPTGMRGAELNSRMMGIFAGIKDPVLRDVAWEYLKFRNGKEAVEIQTRIMVEGGYGPFIHPKYLRMFGYEEMERLAPKGWAETFEIAIRTGKPEPYGRNSNYAYDLMTLPLQKMVQLALVDQLPQEKDKRFAIMMETLKEANARANEEMIGVMSKEERTRRDVLAVIVLIVIVIAFSFLFWYVGKSFVPPKTLIDINAKKRKGFSFRNGWAYVLLLPALLTIVIWQYIPLAQGLVMGFQDYRVMGNSIWVGVQNFGDVLFDYKVWWVTVWNAFRYSLLVIALTFIPPVILAILLQEIPRGTVFFRIIYYLPAVMSGLVTMLLWKQFYDASELGVLNRLIMSVPAIVFILLGILLFAACFMFAKRLFYHQKLFGGILTIFAGLALLGTLFWLARGVLFPVGEPFLAAMGKFFPRLIATTPEPYRWLQNPDTAMLSCIIPLLWAHVGPGCLLYLAALKSIPEEAYEAADIDGATFVDKVIFIVFPMLKAILVINFVGAFVSSWYNSADNILVMTGGGAGTEVAALHIFYKAFTYLKFGPATAMAWILGLMLVGFTVYQLRVLTRMEFKTVKK